MIHAPRVELGDADDDRDDERQERADAVDEEAGAPALFLVRDVVLRHARLRQREAREHADRVEADEVVDLGVGDDDEHGRRDGEEDDPVREDEPVAALGELARHEVVARVEAREAREVGEAGVRGEDQDERGAGLQHEVQDGSEAPTFRRPASPICEMTVGVPFANGATCILAARIDRPRNITPSVEPMITSVSRAFFHSGTWNAGTPFEIASTPVTAAPPFANAVSTLYERGAHEESAADVAEVHDADLVHVLDGQVREEQPVQRRSRAG